MSTTDVTFDLPDDLVEKVRRKAEASGTTMEQMIRDAIQRIADGELPKTSEPAPQASTLES